MPSALKYICPVCGFLLQYPPEDFNICPSCGVEFGADTVEYSIQELQRAWIDRGMTWTSRVLPRPAGFNPLGQLERLHAHATNGRSMAPKIGSQSSQQYILSSVSGHSV